MGKTGKRRSSPGPLEPPAAKAPAVGTGANPASRTAAAPTVDDGGMGELEGVEDDGGESDGDEVVSEAESSDFDGDEERASRLHPSPRCQRRARSPLLCAARGRDELTGSLTLLTP
jgi:hypothetical protein